MMSWLKSGKISDTSTFVDGFENLPQGILGLFNGTNTGKMRLVIWVWLGMGQYQPTSKWASEQPNKD